MSIFTKRQLVEIKEELRLSLNKKFCLLQMLVITDCVAGGICSSCWTPNIGNILSPLMPCVLYNLSFEVISNCFTSYL